ncbi:MAG: hypothetical protein KatS3mg038_0767 [Candidatus Kapaibacterium sp.]|nr:MAG: hypothetical protein KatS3mg038_0767 [Candidatus Kapabacteria bacterium]
MEIDASRYAYTLKSEKFFAQHLTRVYNRLQSTVEDVAQGRGNASVASTKEDAHEVSACF